MRRQTRTLRSRGAAILSALLCLFAVGGGAGGGSADLTPAPEGSASSDGNTHTSDGNTHTSDGNAHTSDGNTHTDGIADGSAQKLGRRLYRDGLLPSGRPVRATVQGDVALDGTQSTCASCHGRSGLGTSEVGGVVSPVREAYLYAPRAWRPSRLPDTEKLGPRPRPAYTDASLARAIRTGFDPTGRPLDTLMPRFDIDKRGMRLLIRYLRSLSATPSPGVTDTTIHWATIVGEGADPVASQGMLDVLRAYTEVRNSETRRETERGKRGIEEKRWIYGAFRTWSLHVWELAGPRESWQSQLETLYRQQPVFGILNGIVDGPWEPIHDFCESRELPCLFPNTDLPVVREGDFYTVYLSKGLMLEAQALARHLEEPGRPRAQRPVIQIFRDDAEGSRAARSFRDAMQQLGSGAVRDVKIGRWDPVTEEFWADVLAEAGTVVLWLRPRDLTRLPAELVRSIDAPYLSASLVGRSGGSLPQILRERAHLIYPFGLPEESARSLRRVRAWMSLKGIPLTAERAQANAYLAGALANKALKHARTHLWRDYFLEILEHQVDYTKWTSVYGHLGLGRGQRFASKGCYIVRLGADGEPSPVSDWIIP